MKGLELLRLGRAPLPVDANALDRDTGISESSKTLDLGLGKQEFKGGRRVSSKGSGGVSFSRTS